jgi:hypothetical protein
MDADDFLLKLVIAKTGQGEIYAIGHCVSYTTAPTVVLKLADGSRLSWRADLCTVVDIDERAVELLFPPAVIRTL